QYPAVFHRTEQRVVETLHRIAAARRRGMKRVAKHAETEAGGKSDGFAQRCFWDTGLADRVIEDRWKRAYRHVPSPCSTVELIQNRRGTPALIRHSEVMLELQKTAPKQ